MDDEALASIRAGRLDEAEAHLEARLEAHPDDARALRMLGTLCHVGGRTSRARRLLERSLELEPDNPSTLLNLGSVHLQEQRDTEARACFSRVVSIVPESPDGHFNLGLSAQRSGRLEEAEDHYLRALERDPEALDTLVNLAEVHLRQRNDDACLERLSQVLARDPAHAWAHLTRVQALIGAGHLQQAEQALGQVPEDLLENPDLCRLEGDLRFRGGRFSEAVRAYAAALSRGDPRMDTRLDLGRCLLEAGREEAAVEALREATDRFPGEPECHALLGLALYQAGLLQAALEAYDTALVLAPKSMESLTMRARVLHELGREREAEQTVEAVISDAPGEPTPHLLRMEQRLTRGNLPGALSACDDYLGRHGLEWNLLAARAFLLHALGRPGEAERLMDYDRLLSSWIIEAPEGYDNLEHFNRVLARQVRAHPSLSHEGAASRATQHGRQSGNLLFDECGPFADFQAVLWKAAERYLRALPRDPGHPYLASPASLDAVYGWGVVLQRSGHQTPHIHPTAWLSGVYYVELPQIVRRVGSQQGWIEFGAPPPELALTPCAPTRMVKPEEGLIVLFPSYFYHRTVPYDADGERISIAFDFSPPRRSTHRC